MGSRLGKQDLYEVGELLQDLFGKNSTLSSLPIGLRKLAHTEQRFIDLAFYPYSLTLRNHSQLDKPIFLLSADDDLEVPFVFEMPKKYEQLVDLLTKYRPQKTDVVLQR